MNSQLLKSHIIKNDGTQKQLAEAIGLASSTLNAKIKGHREFTVNEVIAISQRYNLTNKEMHEIFFK